MLVVKAPQSELLATVKRVAGVAPGRSTLPIISNLLLQKSGDALKLTATDLDVQATVTASLGGDAGEFSSTISAKRLTDVLATMASDQVVSIIAKGDKLEVRGGRSRFNLHTLSAEDYPLMAPVVEGARFTLPQRRLRGLLESVGFAMAVSDVRYYLVGTLLEIGTEGIVAVATDGAMMARASVGEAGPESQVIIPRAAALNLLKLVPASDDPVDVCVANERAMFEFGSSRLITKLVVGRFPDYRRAMPKDLAHSVTLGRAPLINALRAVSVITTQKFQGVRVKFSPGEVRFESRVDGEDVESTLEIDYGGPVVELGFDAKKLAQGLESTDEDMVRLAFDAGNTPMPLSMTLPDGDSSYRFVLMPMRV